jgi:hypothetical protein
MTRHERSSKDDPTAERTADQTTQTAGGLGAGTEGPDTEVNRDSEREQLDDPARRRRDERDTTPRRYDEGVQENPVMPSDEPNLRTEI